MDERTHPRQPVPVEPLAVSREVAAHTIGVGVRKLFDLLAPRGPIPVVRIGTRVLVPIDGLRTFIANEAAKTPTNGGTA